jgi:hypothetical protein
VTALAVVAATSLVAELWISDGAVWMLLINEELELGVIATAKFSKNWREKKIFCVSLEYLGVFQANGSP